MTYLINCPEDLDRKFKYSDRIEYTCKNCGKRCNVQVTNTEIHKLMLCKSCLLALHNRTHHEKYDKAKQNLLSTKGVSNVSQLEEVKSKVKSTMQEKYGGYTLSSDELKKKYESTCIEKYGVDNPSKSEDIKSKIKDTMSDKYGGFTLSSPILKDQTIDKIKTTMKDKYGQEYYLHSKEFKNKMIEEFGTDKPYVYGSQDYINLMIDKYGCDSYLKTAEFKETMSYLRANFPEIFQSKRIVYNGISFDSIPEFCVYMYCIDHWIPIARNYVTAFNYTDSKGVIHSTYPDFNINGQLVEIKGAHFFKEDGTMYLPYRDPEWSDEEYEYMCSIYESKRQCLIKNNVLILKDTDPWVQNCINWVKTLEYSKGHYGFDCMNEYMRSNPNNLCYGYTPFNIDKDKQYQEPIGEGKTPFGGLNEF